MLRDSFDFIRDWFKDNPDDFIEGVKIISINDVPENGNVQSVELEFDSAEHYKKFVEEFYDEDLDSVHDWGGCKYGTKDLKL